MWDDGGDDDDDISAEQSIGRGELYGRLIYPKDRLDGSWLSPWSDHVCARDANELSAREKRCRSSEVEPAQQY